MALPVGHPRSVKGRKMGKREDNKTADRIAEAVVAELDYDMWKELYVKGCMEDPAEAKATRLRLREKVLEAMEPPDLDGGPNG